MNNSLRKIDYEILIYLGFLKSRVEQPFCEVKRCVMASITLYSDDSCKRFGGCFQIIKGTVFSVIAVPFLR